MDFFVVAIFRFFTKTIVGIKDQFRDIKEIYLKEIYFPRPLISPI
jgi:hypothetical protein